MDRRLSSALQAANGSATTRAAEAIATCRIQDDFVSRLLTPNTAQWALMRRRGIAPAIGADFGDHETLRTLPIAHQHELAGAQFGNAETAQRFHMNENVGRTFTGRQEAEAANAVEPLYLE